jgi:hypothetical protein
MAYARRTRPLGARGGLMQTDARARSGYRSHTVLEGKNAAFDWDSFDPVDYVEHNYATLRQDDGKILVEMREYFAAAGIPHREPGKGIDVGSGPNLYPALAMLPFCKEITLSDVSASNIKYLDSEVLDFSKSWDDFWNVLAESSPYSRIKDPRADLRIKATLKPGDLFKLSRAEWNIGTMFFVAESISSERHEFDRAINRFVRALKPGAPFAAAFMESSEGYWVGGRPYPAVAIGKDDVDGCLRGIAYDVSIQHWPVDTDDPLRLGYKGMILALGRASG